MPRLKIRRTQVAELFPASKTNPALRWKQIDGKDHLSVLAWMKTSDYEKYYESTLESGTAANLPPGVSLWVTLVPQIKQFCQSLTQASKQFRIKQFLGLNPNRRYETFVEFWIQPENLFRPCPDPEISDQVCELTFDDQNPPQVKNIENYGVYFRHLINQSYGPDGAPWTRLGYTYDWAYNRRNIGASEYIMVPEAEYYVSSAHTTEEYCQ